MIRGFWLDSPRLHISISSFFMLITAFLPLGITETGFNFEGSPIINLDVFSSVFRFWPNFSFCRVNNQWITCKRLSGRHYIGKEIDSTHNDWTAFLTTSKLIFLPTSRLWFRRRWTWTLLCMIWDESNAFPEVDLLLRVIVIICPLDTFQCSRFYVHLLV